MSELLHVVCIVEVRGPAELISCCSGVIEAGGVHDLEVLLVLRGGARGDFVEPVALRVLETAEAIEGGEELVVAAPSGAGDEAAHGEAVDHCVVDCLDIHGVGDGHLSGSAGAVVRLREA